MIVGTGVVVEDRLGRLLLVRRSLPPEEGRWSLPGGKAKSDEMPHEAAVRELREETGCSAEIEELLGSFVYRVPADDHESIAILLKARIQGQPKNTARREHSALGFFSRDQLPGSLAQPAVTAYEKLRNRATLPDALASVAPEILLIAPYFPLADAEALSIPLGLATMHACLEQEGFDTVTLDCSLAGDYTSFIVQSPRWTPAIIGVQFHSDMSYRWSIRACLSLKRLYPQSLIVAGGEIASINGHSLLEGEAVDLVVQGEGERTMVDVAKAVLRSSQALSEVPGLLMRSASGAYKATRERPYIAALDGLPLPAIRAFRWRDYGQWSTLTSRGCPFKCMYCSSAAYWKHSIRYHSARRVVAEIERLSREFSAEDIYIADDTFTLDRSRVLEICRRLGDQEFRTRWSCLTRVDLVDRELLAEMRRAGCVLVSFGVESANDGTLRHVSKSSQSRAAQKALSLCHAAGIRTRVSVIVGLPGETKADLARTLEFLKRTRPNEIQLYGLTPHDGTALYANLDSVGVRVLEPDRDKWSRSVLEPVCETEFLSAADIAEVGEEYISVLQEDGYVYLTEHMPKRKIFAERTVATAFAPVQAIGGPAQAV